MSALLPVDPVLREFPNVLDADLMGERFAAAMPASRRIEACRVERFRYRSGERAIVQYELAVREEDGSMQPVWAWGTLWPDARAERRAQDLPSETGFLEPQSGMLLQLFPHDRRLPEIEKTMAALRSGSSELLGNGSLEQMQVMRFRPGIGATLRIKLQSGRTLYVKVCSEGSARARFEALRAIAKAADGFKVCTPVGVDETLRAVSLEAASGSDLQSLLLRGNADPADLAHETAAALAALHDSTPQIGSIRGPNGFAKRARKQAAFLQWALPEESERIAFLMNEIERRLKPVTLQPAHLDMKADHLFLGCDAPTFIDLDSFAASDPVFDVAMLAARVEAMKDIAGLSMPRARRFRDTLVDSYFSGDRESSAMRFGFNYACAALKVALYFVQHLEADWPDRVRTCLAKAEEALLNQYGVELS